MAFRGRNPLSKVCLILFGGRNALSKARDYGISRKKCALKTRDMAFGGKNALSKALDPGISRQKRAFKSVSLPRDALWDIKTTGCVKRAGPLARFQKLTSCHFEAETRFQKCTALNSQPETRFEKRATRHFEVETRFQKRVSASRHLRGCRNDRVRQKERSKRALSKVSWKASIWVLSRPEMQRDVRVIGPFWVFFRLCAMKNSIASYRRTSRPFLLHYRVHGLRRNRGCSFHRLLRSGPWFTTVTGIYK